MWRGALGAEWLKQRRTGAWAVVMLPPVGLVVVLVWYLSHLSVSDPEVWFARVALEGWASLFVPAGAGLLAGLAAAREVTAGNWVGLRSRPMPPVTLYTAKLLVVMGQAMTGTVLLAGAVLLGGALFVQGVAPWQSLLAAAGCVWFTAVPLLAIHLWLATARGLGASLAVGGAGMLVASLIGGTSLGEGAWQWVPWAWPVRVAASVMTGAWSQVTVIIAVALGLSVVLAAASLLWFERWEGSAAPQ